MRDRCWFCDEWMTFDDDGFGKCDCGMTQLREEKTMTDQLNEVPAKVRDLYRDLQMMQHIMLGHPYKKVAASYGVSARTCSRRVKDIASECMRQAMEQTQGDPDHPAQVRWTVEDFCADSRGCMIVMMKHHIEQLEREHPNLVVRVMNIGGPG